MEPRFEALKKLCENGETAKTLFALSPAEAAVVLKEKYNLEFSEEELTEVGAGIRAALEEDSGDELSEDQLVNVAGGGNACYNAGYYIGKGVKVAGTIVGIASFVITVGW